MKARVMARPAGRRRARLPGVSNLSPRSRRRYPPWSALKTTIPKDRRSAQTLGTEREGHGALIGDDGLILTIGYLIMEADSVTITDIDGNELPAYSWATTMKRLRLVRTDGRSTSSR